MNQILLRSLLFRFCFIFAGQIALATANVSTTANAGFHREDCYRRVTDLLQSNNSTVSRNPSLFFSTADSTNPILTLNGCQQLCGFGTGWYPDRGSRLVAWTLPVILLVFNIQYAPIGIQRFLLIPHLIGDPIDSTWSLLEKVDSWSRCYAEAQELLKDKIEIKSLTEILTNAEESLQVVDHDVLKFSALRNKGLMMETALVLSENRRNDILRTSFAVALYIFQVLAAFVPAIGASASPSGGRIATAIILSWLLPVVLLSNAIGDSGSLRNRQQIMTSFMERSGQREFDQNLGAQSTSK